MFHREGFLPLNLDFVSGAGVGELDSLTIHKSMKWPLSVTCGKAPYHNILFVLHIYLYAVKTNFVLNNH